MITRDPTINAVWHQISLFRLFTATVRQTCLYRTIVSQNKAIHYTRTPPIHGVSLAVQKSLFLWLSARLSYPSALTIDILQSYTKPSVCEPSFANNQAPSKVRHEITCPFPNFNGATVEVWEWISNFIPPFTMDVITYPCQDLS